ncbi:protein PHYTOCHROME KINASE SUBSTRATE 4-like [Musa acuminata AAA Group]|uniref:protein PHYTOCHROME KINASE SUBSTRATE 4-like n=1 Tax=Musa acuminata AAA Group TaxID=214697 RepID=UPI0031DA2D95
MATRGTAERVRSTRLRQARRRPAGIASRGSSPTPPSSIAVAASALLLNEPAKPPSFPACRLFGRNCPCYGRKSVDVDETCSEPKSSIRSGSDLNASSTAKNRCFRTGEMGLNSFPDRVMPEETKNEFGFEEMIKQPIRLFPCLLLPRVESVLFEQPRRRATTRIPGGLPANQAYRSSAEHTTGFTTCRRGFPILRPGKPPKFHPNPPPDDDVASYTSSDLFEIESFSTQTTYRRPDSLDSRDHLRGGLEAEVPPPSNAPSEASVQWSVTTAPSGRSASAAPPRAGSGDAAVF